MRTIKIIILIGVTAAILSSCATIVSKSNYPIAINSSPSEAKITITNKKGLQVFQGNTPANISLKAGSGFFSRESYQVKFEKDGYDTKLIPVEFKVDGWYFGNIVFGGVIGLLILDPATGAMYKLKTEFLNETLTKSIANNDVHKLNIFDINNIPEHWKSNLIAIK